MVGFNRRFAPLAQALKSEMESAEGPMTAQYRVNAGPLPAGHWLLDPEQGGGRILGEVCHFVDFLTFLFGSLPRRLTTTSTGGGGTQDVIVQIEFVDDSLASIVYVGSGDRALPKERLEVFGGGKAAVLEDFRRLTIAQNGKLRSRGNRLRQDKGHRGAWEAFVAAITRGGPPPIPNEQLFAVAMATLAADESLRSGETREVSQLPIGE
jgi:predicted dehydrogenase